MYVTQSFNTEAEWLTARLDGIGGSEIAAIMGASHWQTAADVWKRKTDRKPIIEDALRHEDSPMELGHDLEKATFDRWRKSRKGRYAQIPVIAANPAFYSCRDTEHTWRMCTPDFLALDQETGGIIPVEVKTTAYPEPDSSLKPEWRWQLLWQMAILGTSDGILIARDRIRGGITEYRLSLSDPQTAADKEQMLLVADAFWQTNVMRKIMPPPTCEEDVRLLHPQSLPAALTAEFSIECDCEEMARLAAEIKDREKRYKEIKDRVIAFMDQCEELRNEDGKTLATFKTGKEKTAPDMEKIKQAIQAIGNWADFQKTTPGSRTFLLKTKNLFNAD